MLAMLGLCGPGCGNDVRALLPDGGATPQNMQQRWPRLGLPAEVAGRNLFAVSGAAFDSVVIVGERGTVLSWDGMKLSLQPAVTDKDLKAVTMVSPTRGFAVGDLGTILRLDGTTWSLEPTDSTANLLGVWADDTRALAVGESGAAVLLEAPMPWRTIMNDSPDHLHGVASVGGQVVAVGTLGTVSQLRGRGMMARMQRSAVRDYLKTLEATSSGPGGTFAVGVDGAVFQWQSGFRRVKLDTLPASVLRGVASTDGGLFVVGNDATVARVVGMDVLVYPDIPERWAYGVWGSSGTDVWVVGASGMLLHGPPLVDPVGVMP